MGQIMTNNIWNKVNEGQIELIIKHDFGPKSEYGQGPLPQNPKTPNDLIILLSIKSV